MKPFVIRCETPDCDWGHKMHGVGEDQLRFCYSKFREHCIQRHDLEEWDSPVHLDLKWMLTLIKVILAVCATTPVTICSVLAHREKSRRFHQAEFVALVGQ